MQDEATTLPSTWARVVDRYVQRYGIVRCERWNEELVYVKDGLPKPIRFDDPVLQGFARKAARTLESVCTGCGSQAKRRFHGTGWTVQCAACSGKASLAQQITELIDQALGGEVNPFDRTPVLWLEHELPLLLSSCIPTECWRYTTLPEGQTIRYVAREDVQGLSPWLMRLKQVMQRTSSPPLRM